MDLAEKLSIDPVKDNKIIKKRVLDIVQKDLTIQKLANVRQGKTIKDVAREAGVCENAIYRWSTNEPKISTLRKVTDVLGIDYKVLLPQRGMK